MSAARRALVYEEQGTDGELRRRLVEQHGAVPARADLLAIGAPRGVPDQSDPRPASAALLGARRMTVAYLDASALVKLMRPEPETDALIEALPGGRCGSRARS